MKKIIKTIKEGKAVDLYYLSFGATTFLTGDETYESRMTGWILKKPTKAAQTSSE